MNNVKLGEVSEIKSGAGFPKKYQGQASGDIPFAKVGDISEAKRSEGKVISVANNYVSEGIVANLKAKIFPCNTIVFAKIGEAIRKNNRVITQTPMAFDNNVMGLIPNVRKISSSYLYYFLETIDFYTLSNSTTIPSIRKTEMEQLEVPLPPLCEQKRIAAILDQADALRRSRRRAITRLNDLSASIFHEMFGDPVHNERKWNVEKLDSLTTKISSGSTPKGGSKNYVDDGIVFLRSQNVWRNRLELDDVVYIDEATHQKMKKSSLKNGDILITKTGRINTENSSLGRAAMFLGEDDSANVNGHVYLIRPKPAVLKEFILYIMTTPEYREYIRSVCVGGIDKRQINKEHLEEFPIIYPPTEEQKKFLKKLKAIEEQKARFNEQLELAENLFLSLQQRAFIGEL
ncbi:MAG: hypothetical protein DHS20C02_10960 [Micavibrio sp.]|nr:MAG: hypothetical protein DHS20C02_10960 [Micavibrio sp.]